MVPAHFHVWDLSSSASVGVSETPARRLASTSAKMFPAGDVGARPSPRMAPSPLSADIPPGSERERVLMRFLADQPYAEGGDCPPSPPRSLAETSGRAGADGGGRDWWGLPDDGEGPRVAGETWCGECLTLVGAGPRRCRYQWMRVGPLGAVEPIPGARGPRHVVSELDLGCRLRCAVVTAADPKDAPGGAPVLELGEETVLRFATADDVATPAPYAPAWRTDHPDDDRDRADPEPDPNPAANASKTSSATRARVNPLPEDAVGARGHERSEATRVRVDAASRREIILDPPEGASRHPLEHTRLRAALMEIRGRLLVERASTPEPESPSNPEPPSTSPPWFDVADAFDGVDGSDAPTAPSDASADVSEAFTSVSKASASGRSPSRRAEVRFARARALYAAASDGGHLGARCALAKMTEIGVGGAADRAEATRLYRSGANEGHAECENNLGTMLCAGADPDLAGAAALFERARRRGHAAACFNLAACFEDGAGVARDVERAAALYEKAAAAGVAGAHRAEGHLALVRGHLREATAKFVEGAVNGDPEAAEAARWLADLRKAATAAAAVREVPGSPGGTGDASRGASARTGSASANVSGANVSVSGANVSAFSRPPSQSRVTSLVGAASGTFDAAGDGGMPSSPPSRLGSEDGDEGDGDVEVAAATEHEMTRYYRLSQALYELASRGGDARATRAADDTVREHFPEAIA